MYLLNTRPEYLFMLASDAQSPWEQWILNKAIVMYDRQQKLKEMKVNLQILYSLHSMHKHF